MRYPFDGTWPVSSPFGPRDGGFHSGVDFAVPSGTPMLAVADGTVVYNAFEAGGFGHTVTIALDSGDPAKVGYGHLASPAVVPVGSHVKAGDLLGFSGSTGASTGPHLHLWAGTGPNVPGAVDPLPYFTGDDDVTTQAQMDELGRWMKEQSKLTQDHVLDATGKWLGEVEARLAAKIDGVSVTGGTVDLDALATAVADKLAARLQD